MHEGRFCREQAGRGVIRDMGAGLLGPGLSAGRKKGTLRDSCGTKWETLLHSSVAMGRSGERATAVVERVISRGWELGILSPATCLL